MSAEINDGSGYSVARVSNKHGGIALSVGIGATEWTLLTKEQATDLVALLLIALTNLDNHKETQR